MNNKNLLEKAVWTEWFPRKELKPDFFITDTADKFSLGISTGDNIYVFGKWISDAISVSDSHAVIFEADYLAERVKSEEKNIFAMLSFYDSGGDLLERDYAHINPETKKIYRKVNPPEKSASVKIELGIINCANAAVTWENISLETVEKIPERNVKIATTYMIPCKSPEKNLDMMINLIDNAGKDNPDVILLSENLYESRTGLKVDEIAQPVPGDLTDKIGEYAKKYNTYVIWSMNEKDGDVIYNTAVIVGRDGKVCGKYRKTHLPLTEAEMGVSQGNIYDIFELDFGRIGILICYDQMFPENARILSRMGAEIIFIPTQGEDEVLQRTIARANGVHVVVSGYHGGQCSRIINPLGETVNFVSDEDKGYTVEQIDLNQRFFVYWMSIGPGNGEIKVLFERERRPDMYEDIQKYN